MRLSVGAVKGGLNDFAHLVNPQRRKLFLEGLPAILAQFHIASHKLGHVLLNHGHYISGNCVIAGGFLSGHLVVADVLGGHIRQPCIVYGGFHLVVVGKLCALHAEVEGVVIVVGEDGVDCHRTIAIRILENQIGIVDIPVVINVTQGKVPFWYYLTKFENMTEEEAKVLESAAQAAEPEMYGEEE